ncbi:hypothetical protein Plhal304r1_c010g0039531 [Plasmopara halstedii]
MLCAERSVDKDSILQSHNDWVCAIRSRTKQKPLPYLSVSQLVIRRLHIYN